MSVLSRTGSACRFGPEGQVSGMEPPLLELAKLDLLVGGQSLAAPSLVSQWVGQCVPRAGGVQ